MSCFATRFSSFSHLHGCRKRHTYILNIYIYIYIYICIQKGSSWGLSFFRFLGAEFFRFLGAEFFSAKKKSKNKKNTAHHLHLLVQGHGSVLFVLFFCWLFVGFLFFCFSAFAHKHQENQKTKTKKHSPSSEDNTLLMLS